MNDGPATELSLCECGLLALLRIDPTHRRIFAALFVQPDAIDRDVEKSIVLFGDIEAAINLVAHVPFPFPPTPMGELMGRVL